METTLSASSSIPELVIPLAFGIIGVLIALFLLGVLIFKAVPAVIRVIRERKPVPRRVEPKAIVTPQPEVRHLRLVR